MTLRILMVGLLFFCASAHAVSRIAVLDFELNDLTSLPNTPAERLRTAGIRPTLEQALRQGGEIEIVAIDANALAQANAGFGYLFHFHELAADLGRQAGAEWVVVGRHSKPSFLFSYLMAHLVDVKTRRMQAEFDIELKGNHDAVMRRGTEVLADKIRFRIGH